MTQIVSMNCWPSSKTRPHFRVL
ncbi:hypothetical protein RSAG8_00537, partial [Rhizoctonia solani AG-8 WAC10335]